MFNSSCTQNTPRPDVSAFSTELKVERFESDLFGMDTLHPAESIAKLRAQYGDFFDLYMFQITSLGSPDSSLMQQRVLSFVTDTNFRNVASFRLSLLYCQHFRIQSSVIRFIWVLDLICISEKTTGITTRWSRHCQTISVSRWKKKMSSAML